jgi:hypothetical protein
MIRGVAVGFRGLTPWRACWFAIVWGTVGVGCENDVNDPSPKLPFYAACGSDEQCESNSCGYAIDVAFIGCTKQCDSSADCPPNSGCATTGQGTKICTQPCDVNQALVAGTYFCDGADRVACAGAACAADEQCFPGRGCVKIQPLGGPCSSNDECQSRNCSRKYSVCRVPFASPCTLDNCDICDIAQIVSERYERTDLTACNRECSSDSECGALPNSTPRCESGICRTVCDNYENCMHRPGRDPQSTGPRLALFEPCSSSAACASDWCFDGFCSKGCDADADCVSAATGTTGHCLATNANNLVCFVPCSGDSECKIYSAEFACIEVNQRGRITRVCTV